MSDTPSAPASLRDQVAEFMIAIKQSGAVHDARLVASKREKTGPVG